jgi:hypothetical protein
MTSLRRPGNIKGEEAQIGQNESAARIRRTRTARLKVLAARPALIALTAAGMIAGSASMAGAAVSSPAQGSNLSGYAATTGTNATGTVDLVTALDVLGLNLKADLDLNVPGGTTHAVGVVVSMTTGTSVVTLEIGVSQQNAAQLKAAQALPGSSSIVNLKTMTEPGSRAGA